MNFFSRRAKRLRSSGGNARRTEAPELGSSCALARVSERFDLWSERLVADASYGSTVNLSWLVHERGIESQIPVFGKAARTDGSFARSDFTYDHKHDRHIGRSFWPRIVKARTCNAPSINPPRPIAILAITKAVANATVAVVKSIRATSQREMPCLA